MMTVTERTPQVVRSYLAELDAALGGVPVELARDIRNGVEEELAGLDAATAAARIERLGDPVFIAAEARAGAGVGAGSAVQVTTGTDASRAATPISDSRGFAVVAALLVALGGVVIPVLGWVVGIAMVWMSSSWRRGEKWIATLVGPVAVAVPLLLTAVLHDNVSMASALVPTWWTMIVLMIPVNVVVGIWLLWRTRRRAVNSVRP
jgi:uncharacterized membrane protein